MLNSVAGEKIGDKWQQQYSAPAFMKLQSPGTEHHCYCSSPSFSPHPAAEVTVGVGVRRRERKSEQQ